MKTPVARLVESLVGVMVEGSTQKVYTAKWEPCTNLT